MFLLLGWLDNKELVVVEVGVAVVAELVVDRALQVDNKSYSGPAHAEIVMLKL